MRFPATAPLLNIFRSVMSAADGLPRKEEDGSASLPTLTISDGWQSSNAPVPKTERASGLRGCNPYTIRHFSKPSTKKNPMKPVLRYQSQLLFRKSHKSNRVVDEELISTSLSCSSKAEHPADNRKMQERYLPGQPIYEANLAPE